MKRRYVVATSIVLVLLAWSVVLPNVSVIVGSFARGLDDWRAFASSPADREALWSTLVISVGSVAAALAIGLPLAFLLGRFDFRGRRALSWGGFSATAGALLARWHTGSSPFSYAVGFGFEDQLGDAVIAIERGGPS